MKSTMACREVSNEIGGNFAIPAVKRRERRAPAQRAIRTDLAALASRGSEARVCAVLMLILLLALASFSSVFRFGTKCGWTTAGKRSL